MTFVERIVPVHVRVESVENKKPPPPPLMKLKKTGISATITKAQYLKQNSINQSGEYSSINTFS